MVQHPWWIQLGQSFLLLFVLATACVPAYADTYMLNNQRNGSSPYVGPIDLYSEMTYLNLDDRIVATPVYSKERLYIGTMRGMLICLSEDLEILWETNLGGKLIAPPSVAKDGRLYGGTTLGDVYCVDESGGVLWKKAVQSAVVAPVTCENGQLYVGTWDGRLLCMTAEGDVLWSLQTDYVIRAGPTIGNAGRIIVASMDGHIYALSPEGDLEWSFAAEDSIPASVAVDSENHIYFGSHDGYVYSLTSSGELRWRFRTGNKISATPAVGESGIYVPSLDGSLYALSHDGYLLWENNDCGSEGPCIIDGKGMLYVVRSVYARDVAAIWADTGQVISSFSPIRKGQEPQVRSGHAVLGRDHVYFATVPGHVYMLGKPWTPPPVTYSLGSYLELGRSPHALEETGSGVVAVDWRDGTVYIATVGTRHVDAAAQLPNMLYDMVIDEGVTFAGFTRNGTRIQGYDLTANTLAQTIPLQIILDWPSRELWGIELDEDVLYLLSPAPTPQELVAYDMIAATVQQRWILPDHVSELIGLELVDGSLFAFEWSAGKIHRIELHGTTVRLVEFLNVGTYIPRSERAGGGFRGMHFGEKHLYVTTVSGSADEAARLQLLEYSAAFETDPPHPAP